MATSKAKPHDFIQDTFAPMIAVASSPGVDEVCKKNNLEFVTLLKPFSKSTVEGFIKDPSGASTAIQPRVCFSDINSRPPPLNVARSYFNEALSSNVYERTSPFKAGNVTIDIPHCTPWFDAWRSAYLQVQYPSDHEFTKHYVGCLIMVSSLDQSPVEQVARISQDITDSIFQNNNKLPKWFGPLPSILFTYGYLHDSSVCHPSLSVRAFEAITATYGSQRCFFLAINSHENSEPMVHVPDPWLSHLDSLISYKENQPETDNPVEVESAQEMGEKFNAQTPVLVHPLSPVSDDPSGPPSIDAPATEKISVAHGMLLSLEDIGRIVQFVNEFCSKALIPHFEQLIQSLTDQVSNKKGMSRSLFSATKRLFGNKPGAQGHQMSPTAIAYSIDSHELQLRKLGDLCFMIGIYTPAYNAYHSAKRDFYADGAWLHYAGALEMAALAAFMSENQQLVKKMIEYSEESINTYQTSCRFSPFATRATLLSSECLKGRGLYGEAAKQLIRMSGEDSDLRSAVLLEQAAYCFLHCPRPVMFRKYAFHMVLAGNRYSKASHKNHSMRCYYQAHQVYESKNWSIAEDHILFTIGKHASQLKLIYNGFEALSGLVKRSSRQIPNQQSMYFKDYLLSVESMVSEGDVGALCIPVADGKQIQVLLNVTADDAGNANRITASGFAYNKSIAANYLNDTIWVKLEEKLVNVANAANVFIFTPTVGILNDKTKNNLPATIVAGEPVGIQISLKNPLHIPVTMTNVSLLWTHNPEIPTEIGQPAAVSSVLSEATFQPDSAHSIMMMLTPLCVGELQVTSLRYTLQESGTVVEGVQHLIPVPHVRSSDGSHEADQRLVFKVIELAPLLHVSFSGLKSELFHGEIMPIIIHLRNDGALEISQIIVSCSDNFELHVDGIDLNNDDTTCELGVSLLPKESRAIPVKIHPSWLETGGTQVLNMLFYYTNKTTDSKPRYRLVRHSWPTEVLKAYNLDVSARFSDHRDSQTDTVSLNVALQIKSALANQTLCDCIEMCSVAVISRCWQLSSTVFQPEDPAIRKNEDVFLLIGANKHRLLNPPISKLPLIKSTAANEPKGFIPRLIDSVNLDREMILMINWRYHRSHEGVDELVFGQDYRIISVVEENLKPVQPELPEPAPHLGISCLEKLVDYRLLYDSFIEEEGLTLSRNRSLVLNVMLKLLNRSGEPQYVKVVADRSELKSTSNLRSSCWTWQGKGLYEYRLEPYQDNDLCLEAEFYRRGTYNLLGGLDIMVKIGDDFVLQNDPFRSYVIIVK